MATSRLEEANTDQTKLYQEVYDACMAFVASVTGVAPSPEVLSLVASAASEAVAQHTGGASSTTACVAQAVGTVASEISGVGEATKAKREASAASTNKAQKAAKKVVQDAVKVAFKTDGVYAPNGGNTLLSPSDELYVQDTLEAMFAPEGGLPTGAEYVLSAEGELVLKMPLPGAQGRYVMLPAESLRYVQVQKTADNDYNLIVMSAPEMGPDGKPTPMQRRVISWEPEGVSKAIGGDVGVDALVKRMQQDEELSRQLFEAHQEVMRFEVMRRALEAQAEEAEKARETERLSVVPVDVLSAIEAAPTELPPANDNTQLKLSTVM